MRFAITLIASLISAAILSGAFALGGSACEVVEAGGPRFIENCGNQLHAFSLSISERSEKHDMHGHFYFVCPDESMCAGEPSISGHFILPDIWLKSAKDERVIYQLMLFAPPGGGWGDRAPPMPSTVCSPFDVTIGWMAGRMVCFEEAGNMFVVLVASDDHVGFLLSFFAAHKTTGDLRDKVLEMLPRFKVERATGDAALKWLR